MLVYSYVPCSRYYSRGLIFTVFTVHKHLQKLNQRIIKIVTSFTSCQSRGGLYRPHMTLLQYLPPWDKSVEYFLAHVTWQVQCFYHALKTGSTSVKSLRYTTDHRFFFDYCHGIAMHSVGCLSLACTLVFLQQSPPISLSCSTWPTCEVLRSTLYRYQQVDFSRHLPVCKN